MSPTMRYTNRHIRRRFRSLLGQQEQTTDVLLQTGVSRHRQEQRVRRGSAGYKVEQSGRVLEEPTVSSRQKSAQEIHVSSHSRVSDKVGDNTRKGVSIYIHLRHCLGLWHCI